MKEFHLIDEPSLLATNASVDAVLLQELRAFETQMGELLPQAQGAQFNMSRAFEQRSTSMFEAHANPLQCRH